MKYFTTELLNMPINFTDPESDLTEKLWMDNLKAYWNEFKKYEYRLPARFVKEYEKHAFHDYEIKAISFSIDDLKKKSSYVVEMKLQFDKSKYLIRYLGVSKYTTSLKAMQEVGENVLLYNELLPIDSTSMSNVLILVNGNRICIEFKKLAYKKLRDL